MKTCQLKPEGPMLLTRRLVGSVKFIWLLKVRCLEIKYGLLIRWYHDLQKHANHLKDFTGNLERISGNTPSKRSKLLAIIVVSSNF